MHRCLGFALTLLIQGETFVQNVVQAEIFNKRSRRGLMAETLIAKAWCLAAVVKGSVYEWDGSSWVWVRCARDWR